MANNNSTPLEDEGIPVIYLTGSHFDIGLQVGKTFKSKIHTAIEKHSSLESQLVPFYNTSRGKTAYDQLLSASEKYVPRYVEEIKGIASGAEVEFYKLFLLHIEADVISILRDESEGGSVQANEGCSDFFVRNKDWTLHVHSEDADPGTRYLGCVWMADIAASNGCEAESFISFAYPGMIPGNAWTVNSHGLKISGNIIFQKQQFLSGMAPRRLLARGAMNEKSIDAFMTKLETMPAFASAFNFMVSQRACDEDTPECVEMTSIEIVGKSAGNQIMKTPVKEFQYHYNEFQWMTDEPFFPDFSSIAREKRLEELGVPSTLDHIKSIMSDEKNGDYPFFRDGAPPDFLATANIAITDRYKDRLDVYKFKPSDTEPTLSFDIKPWAGKATNTRLIR